MTKIDEAVEKQALQILEKPYARRLVPDEAGGFVASIHEFPGCIAEGDTAEEALSNLNIAAESWLEAALLNNYSIREPAVFHGYSGKIALRIPRGLHKQIAELADLEDTSINQLLVAAVSQYLSNRNSLLAMKDCLVSEIRGAMQFTQTINVFTGVGIGTLLQPQTYYEVEAPNPPPGNNAPIAISAPVNYGQFNFEIKQMGTC